MYTVHLSQFEGPLDALLHLVSRARVDIREIFVSQITEQYLASMQSVGELDMDSASEFTRMASMLLEIKSRSLLPRPPKIEEGEEDPEQALIRRLEEYKRYREVGERLKQMEDTALLSLYRLPDELVSDTRVELTGLTLTGLTKAFARILARIASAGDEPPPAVSYVRRDTWTVQQCMFRIQSRLAADASVRFEELFDTAPARAEAVMVFIALLELWRVGAVRIEQEGTFAPINLYKG